MNASSKCRWLNRLGFAELGATKSNQYVIWDQLLDSNPLLLTGNTDTVYCIGCLDLQTDGPTVVEIPPGSGPGTVNDAFFRFVVDLGAPGPDKGKGGKYLIVPAGYQGEVPKDGYFIAHSPSYVNILGKRARDHSGNDRDIGSGADPARLGEERVTDAHVLELGASSETRALHSFVGSRALCERQLVRPLCSRYVLILRRRIDPSNRARHGRSDRHHGKI